MKNVEKKLRKKLQELRYEYYFGKRSLDHRNEIDEVQADLTHLIYNGHSKLMTESQYRTSDYWMTLLGYNYDTYSRLVSSDVRAFVSDVIFGLENQPWGFVTFIDRIMETYELVAGRSEIEDLSSEQKAWLAPFVNLKCWEQNIIGSHPMDMPYFRSEFIEPMWIGYDSFQFDEHNDDESWGLCPVKSFQELNSLMVAVGRFIKMKDDEKAAEPEPKIDFPLSFGQ